MKKVNYYEMNVRSLQWINRLIEMLEKNIDELNELRHKMQCPKPESIKNIDL